MAGVRGEGADLLLVLEEQEREVLQQLLGEMEQVLEDDGENDVVARLLPRAYESDDDERSYREIAGGQLRDEKQRAYASLRESLQRQGTALRLKAPDVGRWLAALTDMRLAIGTKVGVSEEKMEQQIDPDEPDAGAMAVLHWLGWLQGTMLEELERREP